MPCQVQVKMYSGEELFFGIPSRKEFNLLVNELARVFPSRWIYIGEDCAVRRKDVLYVVFCKGRDK